MKNWRNGKKCENENIIVVAIMEVPRHPGLYSDCLWMSTGLVLTTNVSEEFLSAVPMPPLPGSLLHTKGKEDGWCWWWWRPSSRGSLYSRVDDTGGWAGWSGGISGKLRRWSSSLTKYLACVMVVFTDNKRPGKQDLFRVGPIGKTEAVCAALDLIKDEAKSRGSSVGK